MGRSWLSAGEMAGVGLCHWSPAGRPPSAQGRPARIWDSSTGRPAGTIMRHEGQVLAVRFSPDSSQILTGSADKTARLWTVPSGVLLGVPIQHSHDVWTVSFSPDGARLLTVVRD